MTVTPSELALYAVIAIMAAAIAALVMLGIARAKKAEPKILIAGARDMIHEAGRAVARMQAAADEMQADAARAAQELEALKASLAAPALVPASLTLSTAPASGG